ncbi:hypothetical protein [Hydrogenophaga taeniospiralis]|uniref:hypothetical protein n=1 Tax=Hydrogenophaga taeniospiralis TaxID=65656 RepID=UPI001CFC0EE4|nr:hypothetical protein [Hydrogenophaga taeniospiralis]UCU92310.1 hypothetical protein KI616_15805 [Hydrogenophaga taeniospiralis]
MMAATGCAFKANYNPSYFGSNTTTYESKIPGVAAIEASDDVKNETFTSSPTSFTGGGTKLTLPVGEIVTQAALLSFRDIFSGGAEIIEPGKYTSSHSVIVKPKFRSMTYEYNQLKNLGFAVTPTASVSIELNVEGLTKKSIVNEIYESGAVESEAYFATASPGDEISKAFHKAVIGIARKSADSVHKSISKTGDVEGRVKILKDDEL